jgi:hypothetical protein
LWLKHKWLLRIQPFSFPSHPRHSSILLIHDGAERHWPQFAQVRNYVQGLTRCLR